MWILKATCHYGGHDWKDGHKVGSTCFAYTSTLPAPYAKGQHPRVGSTHSVVTCEHFTFERAAIADVIRLIPTVYDDMKKGWRRVLGRKELPLI